MPQLPVRTLALYAAAALAVVVVGLKYIGSDKTADSAAEVRAPVAVDRQDAATRVYVSGAVRRAGVYKMSGSSRVDDAAKKAGGATSSADLNSINLAARLRDGQQVVVPEKRKEGTSGVGGAAPGEADQQVSVSLSSATQSELEQLDGVGPATAKKIVEYRQKHGGFGSIEDLKEIGGIGEKKFDALKDSVQP